MSGVSGNQDADIDIGQLFAAVWDRRRTILATTAIVGVLAFVGASFMTPDFKAETRILIEARGTNIAGQEPQGANEPVLDQYNIVSQAQILQSADLIQQVARDLNLSALKEFDPDAHSSLPNLLVLLGLKPDPMNLPSDERVIKTFREKLQVYPVEGSRVIAIEMASEDPKLAAAIPNRMAEVYLTMQSGAKLGTHTDATRWLEPEIATLRDRVREAEQKVADYRTSAGLFQSGENTSFSSQQLNDISAELARVRGERANAEARAENVRAALKSGRNSDTLGDVVGSAMIQRLKETEANVQAEIAQASIALMDGHPRLKGLRGQLSGIRQQIEAETRKILGSLESEANVGKLRETQLMAQLNGLKADSARSGDEEVGLRALEREATAQRQLLETYLARYREASSRVDPNSTPADARIVSTAIDPVEPYFPKIIPITIVMTLAALILHVIGIIVAALFSGRGLRASDRREEEVIEAGDAVSPAMALQALPPVMPAAVQQSLPVAELGEDERQEFTRQVERDLAALKRPVGQVPPGDVDVPRPDIVIDDAGAEAETPPSAVAAIDKEDADALASGSAALSLEAVRDYLLRRGSPLAVLVSPTGDEGSTASVLLAREIAEANRSVVLIDMTGSACPTRLMADNTRLPGITDLLCGTTPFGETIHPDRLSDAHIIPQGMADAAQAMRGIERLGMVLDALAGTYDVVLVECGNADVRSLERLTRGAKAEVILSLPKISSEDIAELTAEYETAGHENVLVMSSSLNDRPTASGRYAA
ncbi:Wzz/FepE/Etk N-terminal domain-containing protein [Rhizobium sp. FY34]|uniref:GumC family protein n=1 Tax=Rhizobium sp. FY34 TaxID=2562309 RepID=UPI0010C08540|nr:Wzz/FepE/Etk N-terminal domain-containing protein [Rhizobium sp. FY34]